MPPLDTRYQAALQLSVVGDSLGFKNGDWSNCSSGLQIFDELEKLGGVNNLNIKLPEWTVSSYTLLRLHTACILTCEQYQKVTGELIIRAAQQCKSSANCWDMKDRNPDQTFMAAREKLNPINVRGSCVPFDPNGISSAAAVRGMCIGLRHPNPAELHDLIKVSIDFGRIFTQQDTLALWLLHYLHHMHYRRYLSDNGGMD
ncbi:inactive ADP-ribosyltransferase arh2-like [Mercenaria mercenaria]|uniref:inactive ADP-ribosyltransferase arh2-like n=1 Tax=Mercenaria mercenaria TaxID=6596 RepID=UPI00234E5507|nr:inactive ADP-ribosyltransferase arh2-like [Mercenaria mercenaria]